MLYLGLATHLHVCYVGINTCYVLTYLQFLLVDDGADDYRRGACARDQLRVCLCHSRPTQRCPYHSDGRQGDDAVATTTAAMTIIITMTINRFV